MSRSAHNSTPAAWHAHDFAASREGALAAAGPIAASKAEADSPSRGGSSSRLTWPRRAVQPLPARAAHARSTCCGSSRPASASRIRIRQQIRCPSAAPGPRASSHRRGAAVGPRRATATKCWPGSQRMALEQRGERLADQEDRHATRAKTTSHQSTLLAKTKPPPGWSPYTRHSRCGVTYPPR